MGSKKEEVIPLVSCKRLVFPKSVGRWGIKNIDLFGHTLPMKSLWRGLNDDGIQSNIMKSKYIMFQYAYERV